MNHSIPQRRWLVLASIGVALVAVALVVVVLVIADKAHFGGLVGPAFLPILTGGIFAGAILVLIGAWKLPVPMKWRVVLIVWALVALTSPLFGFLFLLPFGVLAFFLPAVAWILYSAKDRADSPN
jgi:hypothetical protein